MYLCGKMFRSSFVRKCYVLPNIKSVFFMCLLRLHRNVEEKNKDKFKNPVF